MCGALCADSAALPRLVSLSLGRWMRMRPSIAPRMAASRSVSSAPTSPMAARGTRRASHGRNRPPLRSAGATSAMHGRSRRRLVDEAAIGRVRAAWPMYVGRAVAISATISEFGAMRYCILATYGFYCGAWRSCRFHCRLDRIAMGLSGLCLVHCLATAICSACSRRRAACSARRSIHEVGLTLGDDHRRVRARPRNP